MAETSTIIFQHIPQIYLKSAVVNMFRSETFGTIHVWLQSYEKGGG